MKKFKALHHNVPKEERFYTVNPAFFKGLEIKGACSWGSVAHISFAYLAFDAPEAVGNIAAG
jgi:hypothetical protein